MSEKITRSRFNKIMNDYIKALESDSNPEEVHSRLRSLLSEAISLDMTLVELLKILSGSFAGGNESKFIRDVSSHYIQGEISAKVRSDENEVRKTTARTKELSW